MPNGFKALGLCIYKIFDPLQHLTRDGNFNSYSTCYVNIKTSKKRLVPETKNNSMSMEV